MDFEVVVKFYEDEVPHHEYYNIFKEAKQVFQDYINIDDVKSVVVISYFKRVPTIVLAFNNDSDDYDINFPYWVD